MKDSMTVPPMKRKTRSKQKNLRRDTRPDAIKQEKFGDKKVDTQMNRDKCYNCGEFGHWGKDCTRPKKTATPAQDQPDAASVETAGKKNKSQEVGDAPADAPVAAADSSAKTDIGEKPKGAEKKKSKKSKEPAGESDRIPSKKRSREDADAGGSAITDSASGPEGKNNTALGLNPMKKRKRQSSKKVNDPSKNSGFCVFIGQLPIETTTKESLLVHFEKVGVPAPERLELVNSKNDGSFRGIAFCHFKSQEDRDQALEYGYRSNFGGKRILMEKKNSGGEGGDSEPGSPAEIEKRRHEGMIDSLLQEYIAECPQFLGEEGVVDDSIRTFLRSVSLGAARHTLQDAVKLNEKTLKKLKSPEEKSKFLMGMIKQRV